MNKRILSALLGSLFLCMAINIHATPPAEQEKDTYLKSAFRHTIKPAFSGACLSIAYMLGTSGLEWVCKYNKLEYNGFLKFIGSLGSVSLGWSVLPGSIFSGSTKDDNNTWKTAMYCMSLVISSAVINGVVNE